MHSYKCIFIHIPKNAGTSVLKLFGDEEGRKHAKWYDFFESNDYFFSKYVKFAIVRHPVDRMISAYNYSINGGNYSSSDIALKSFISEQSSSFEEFIDKVLCCDFMMQQPLFLPQYLYIYDRELDIKVDVLLKYENLADDWKMFSCNYKLPHPLPWKNKSTNKVCKSVVSSSSMEKIQRLYRKDFELLGY